MCGVFGVVSFDGVSTEDLASIDIFSDLQRHRGPDGEGSLQGECFVAGMVRLSIIDQFQGTQPIWNESKNIAVLANGEIYNYIELMQDLMKKDHVFSSSSDIEVIVHLYEEYGTNFVTYLRGMFAFVLIDLDLNQVIIGRDRMGEKPLFIYEAAGKFIFSSELRTLVQSQSIPFKLSPKNIHAYLIYGYIPEPKTLIENVRKVESGTLEIFSLEKREHLVHRYWEIDTSGMEIRDSEETELGKLLMEVMELEMRSDVPVGISLSSGIDSCLIAKLAKMHTSELHTFTVGYSNKSKLDESTDAVEFAKSIGAIPHVVRLDPTEVAKRFSELCLKRDEPIADIAGAGYLAIAELAQSQGFKVLLNGQGADELFWGYDWVRKAVRKEHRRRETIGGHRVLKKYLRFEKPMMKAGPMLDWLKAGGGLTENLRQLWEDGRARKNLEAITDISRYRLRARAIARLARSLSKVPEFENTRKVDNLPDELITSRIVMSKLVDTYLKTNGLAQNDRLSMSASIEARTPFVDYKLVEMAFRQCGSANKFDLPAKHFLKSAAKSFLPDNLINKKKKGFNPPTRKWYSAIYVETKNSLVNPRIVELGLVNRKAIKVLRKPLSLLGRPKVLWLELVVLEMWVRMIESKVELKKR